MGTITDKMFNQRIGVPQVTLIRQMNEKFSKIEGMVDLTLGAPDFNTPEHIKQAAIRAIEDNYSHYSPNAGFLSTRQAACHFFKKKYDLTYDPETETIITVGASEALSDTAMSLFNYGAGEMALMSEVSFVAYPGVTYALGGAIPLGIDTSETNFLLTPEQIDQAMAEHGDKIKAVFLNYPSNPTGTTYTEAEIIALADCLRKYDVFVISDEIYSEITYAQKHVSIAKYLKDQTILISGLSKSHAMTGYRIGVIFAPAHIAKYINVFHQATSTCATAVSQKAAEEAWLNGLDDAVVMRDEYEKRRDLILPRLEALGFECAKGQGAFYVWAKIPDYLNQNDLELANELGEKALVAVVPGIAFGQNGAGYIRISYAASYENISLATERIEKFCATYQTN
jgi:aminotransferase